MCNAENRRAKLLIILTLLKKGVFWQALAQHKVLPICCNVMFEPLNLPQAPLQIKDPQGGQATVFDPVRKKYVALTPEEWVRQHFIYYLMSEAKCSKGLIQVEQAANYNKLQKRADILVFDRAGQPWMLVECKAPYVKIDQSVFNQAAVYNKSKQAPYLVVTNGMVHYCCKINFGTGEYTFLDGLPTFPC